jgi:hypothetical protein
VGCQSQDEHDLITGVVADPLPTSFGQDIYDRIGGWLGEAASP